MVLAGLMVAGAAGAGLERGMSAVEKRDWATALREFEPLAEQGNPEAQVNLGNLYMKGYGVEQDYKQAFRWYLKAALQDNAVGEGKLGLMHYYGLGVRENHGAAAGWFRAAAEQGDTGAAAILGSLYAAGDGVPKDKVQAYLWYSVAADRGNQEARDSRDGLVDEMSPGEINEALGLLADWRKRNEPAPLVDEKPPGTAPAPGKKSAAGTHPKHTGKGETLKPAKPEAGKPPKASVKAASPKSKGPSVPNKKP
jgi:TPR repeat protein